MRLFDDGGPRNRKMAVRLLLAAALVMTGGAAVFISATLHPGGPAAYAAEKGAKAVQEQVKPKGGEGAATLLFYLAVLVVLACTGFGIVLERNYREKNDLLKTDRDDWKEKFEKLDEILTDLKETNKTVLAWEKKTEGQGPTLVTLDTKVMDQLDENRLLNEKLKVAANTLADEFTKLLTKTIREVRGSQQESLGELKILSESVRIASELADERKEEVLRYQRGYNLATRKSFIEGIIRAIDFIEELKKRETEPSPALDEARTELLNLLENNEVYHYEPPVGGLYDDHKQPGCETEAEKKESVSVPAGESDGLIVGIIRPGYRLDLGVEGDEHKILRAAEVSVSVAEKPPAEDPVEDLADDPVEDGGQEAGQEPEETTEETTEETAEETEGTSES